MPVSMPLAASTKYDITLSGIKGIATYASGNSLLGSTPKGLYEQIYEYATCFNNKFPDFTTGSNNGYQPMTGFERLSFTTPAGLSSASYTIDIVAYVQDELKIINGMGSASFAN